MQWSIIIILLSASAIHAALPKQYPIDTNITDIGIKFLQYLPDNNASNIAFSPLGLYLTLAFLHMGSRSNTAGEVTRVTGSTDPDPQVVLYSAKPLIYQIRDEAKPHKFEMANAILLKSDIPTKLWFLQQLTDPNIKATQRNISEYAQVEVNRWAKAITNGSISVLIEKPLASNATIHIFNAIFFSGHWREKFDPRTTKEESFYNADKTVSKRQLMKKEETFLSAYDADLDADAVIIPYSGSLVKFCLIVPRSKYGAVRVKNNLTSAKFHHLLSNMKPQRIDLYLPKFTLEASYDLKDFFWKLKVRRVFTVYSNSMGFSMKPNIPVSGVTHKSSMVVDDYGGQPWEPSPTEAPPPQALVVKADHAFLFFVTAGKRNAPIYAGLINKL
ncbi:serpin B3-like [Ornithodoros turicata]|uniref:serpin B3-like n=1 Tax=Ornithodoros turicata TaxID=34597 RepID=UPI003139470C